MDRGQTEPHRRLLMAAGGASLLAASGALAAPSLSAMAQRLAAIEAGVGGRVGVSALDTGSGATIARRADERFAMCSTFKILLAAAVQARIDQGTLTGDRMVPFSKADLFAYAPRTTARLGQGQTAAMSVTDLCAAAVEVSDNTAANLLLPLVDGPAGLTRWLRRTGDPVTRLDRNEPGLNTNLPGDPRDTTTPAAFVRILRLILLGDAVSRPSRDRLTGWMVACETGADRLRAATPTGWKAGDKTGTGDNGAVNDVAIFWPPGRAPILVAVLMSGSRRPTQDLAAAQARIGRTVLAAFA